jgi:hypothetical protein
MEPLEFQWVQQGLSKAIVKWVEKHPMTRGHVNFEDQMVNRELALRGSMSSDIVTLDMSEASDRVSLWLVNELFHGLPFLRHLLGTRTEATELPNKVVHLMAKFAPMGSALCFPVEALVHWSLATAALIVKDELSSKQALRAVYVYGDDIIVKGQNHEALFDTFPDFKLKFNIGKCCTTGSFRESCGMDAFLGQDVSVLKIKKLLPSRPYDATGYASYLEYCNRLWADAYYSTSCYVEDYLVRIYGKIPHVTKTSDVLGIVTPVLPPYEDPSTFQQRWNADLHVKEYKVRGLGTKKRYRPLDRCEYHRKMVTCHEEFVAGVYTAPRSVKSKTRWSSRLFVRPAVRWDRPKWASFR